MHCHVIWICWHKVVSSEYELMSSKALRLIMYFFLILISFNLDLEGKTWLGNQTLLFSCYWMLVCSVYYTSCVLSKCVFGKIYIWSWVSFSVLLLLLCLFQSGLNCYWLLMLEISESNTIDWCLGAPVQTGSCFGAIKCFNVLDSAYVWS